MVVLEEVPDHIQTVALLVQEQWDKVLLVDLQLQALRIELVVEVVPRKLEAMVLLNHLLELEVTA
jgi:hypothetical protein